MTSIVVRLARLELAGGIESPTCGLQTPSDTTSDHLTPQETTNEGTPDRGLDGADLSCPGSSVVADTYQEFPDSVTDDEVG